MGKKRKLGNRMNFQNECTLQSVLVWKIGSDLSSSGGASTATMSPTVSRGASSSVATAAPTDVIAPLGSVASTSVNGFPVVGSMVAISHSRLMKMTESESDTEYLFMRQETVEYYQYLASIRPGKFGVAYGSPGVGKTITMVCFIFHNILQNGYDGDCAVFYQLAWDHCVVVYRAGNNCYIGSTELSEFVENQFSSDNNFNLRYLVLDGVAKGATVDYHLLRLTTHAQNTVVFCSSSMGAQFSSKLMRVRGSQFTVEPWKFETYQEIMKDDFFVGTVKSAMVSETAKAVLDEVSVDNGGGPYNWPNLLLPNVVWSDEMKDYILRDKFHLAGHSARWMFSYAYTDTMNDVKNHIDKVVDPMDLVKGLSGESSEASINHLRCRFRNDVVQMYTCFTSAAIGRFLLEKCDTNVLHSLNQFCFLHSHNVHPSLDGIVVEMDVLHYLKRGILDSRCDIFVTAVNATDGSPAIAESFTPCANDSAPRYDVLPENVYSFTSVNIWQGPPVNMVVPIAGVVFFANVFNHGSFDFVVIRRLAGTMTAEFVQVTRANKHCLNIYFMHTFTTIFNCRVLPADVISAVKITVMCPSEKVRAFDKSTHAAIVGSLANLGWNWDQVEICSFMRTR